MRVKVTQPDGKPVPAGTEVALAAVDQALLELRPNESWKLLEAMLPRRGYEVQTATAQSQVIGKRHFGKKAVPPGGGGGRARPANCSTPCSCGTPAWCWTAAAAPR